MGTRKKRNSPNWLQRGNGIGIGEKVVCENWREILPSKKKRVELKRMFSLLFAFAFALAFVVVVVAVSDHTTQRAHSGIAKLKKHSRIWKYEYAKSVNLARSRQFRHFAKWPCLPLFLREWIWNYSFRVGTVDHNNPFFFTALFCIASFGLEFTIIY